MSAPYGALAAVYDTWTQGNDYGRWAASIRGYFDQSERSVKDVLDVCCGTGSLTLALGLDRYRFTGIDRSTAMLDQARQRLGESGRLLLSELPSLAPIPDCSQDAAVCSFDSLNYVTEPGCLAQAFSEVSRVLRPGGVFVFDVNSLTKMRDVFGNSHYGDDLEDFAYVWRNRFDNEAGLLSFTITLFLRQSGAAFLRTTEEHAQRHFTHEEIAVRAHEVGLSVVRACDDYSQLGLSETTLRETWVLHKTAGR